MTLERREGIIARTCFPPIPGRYHPFPKKVQKQKAIKALRNPRSLGPPSSSSSSSAALLQICSYVTCRLLWALTCPFLLDFPKSCFPLFEKNLSSIDDQPVQVYHHPQSTTLGFPSGREAFWWFWIGGARSRSVGSVATVRCGLLVEFGWCVDDDWSDSGQPWQDLCA